MCLRLALHSEYLLMGFEKNAILQPIILRLTHKNQLYKSRKANIFTMNDCRMSNGLNWFNCISYRNTSLASTIAVTQQRYIPTSTFPRLKLEMFCESPSNFQAFEETLKALEWKKGIFVIVVIGETHFLTNHSTLHSSFI